LLFFSREEALLGGRLPKPGGGVQGGAQQEAQRDALARALHCQPGERRFDRRSGCRFRASLAGF
jgi:hypothetical protein